MISDEIQFLKFSADHPAVFLDFYKAEDHDDFAHLLADAEVMKHVDGPKTESEIEKLFRRALGETAKPGDHIWAIRQTEDLAYVGHAALFCSDICQSNQREILFYLRKSFWHKGYAKTAGEQILQFATQRGYDMAWATVDATHEASKLVCEKIGFQIARMGADDKGEFFIYFADLTPPT